MNNIHFLKKYQPRFYSDFFIDSNLIQLLKLFINNDTLNILIVGNIGSGKSSLLNATIREYYQLDDIPTDNIMYINNLKEQGIQFYRNELKSFCKTTSIVSGKKKIVILDDMDHINDQSQQVFRNCIDKFSHKVHFMASCTNAQKVIDSLQSRCTILKIKPINKSVLKKILMKIKCNEKIILEKNVEKYILKACNNSIRLLINFLEKFHLFGEAITEQCANEICSNINYYEFEKYTYAIMNKNLKSAISIINNLYLRGYSVIDILENYFFFIKTCGILDELLKYKIIKFICKYITVFHTIHEDKIELVLFTNDICNC